MLPVTAGGWSTYPFFFALTLLTGVAVPLAIAYREGHLTTRLFLAMLWVTLIAVVGAKLYGSIERGFNSNRRGSLQFAVHPLQLYFGLWALLVGFFVLRLRRETRARAKSFSPILRLPELANSTSKISGTVTQVTFTTQLSPAACWRASRSSCVKPRCPLPRVPPQLEPRVSNFATEGDPTRGCRHGG